MTGEHEKVLTVGEAIDGLCTIDVTGHGVVRALFTAAHAAQHV